MYNETRYVDHLLLEKPINLHDRELMDKFKIFWGGDHLSTNFASWSTEGWKLLITDKPSFGRYEWDKDCIRWEICEMMNYNECWKFVVKK